MHKIPPRAFVVLAVVVCLVLGGWYLDSRRSEARSTLSGFFETQPIDIASRVAGRVARIDVREGQAVGAGQALVELDAGPNVADLTAKRAAAQQALEQYRDIASGARPEDIARQQEVVREATAQLEALRKGPRPQEIQAARANERAAAARVAAALRGPTVEEKTEAKARLDAALAQLALTTADADRFQKLYVREAVTGQQLDEANAARNQAQARVDELAAAYRRAMRGTPPQELREVEEMHRQARAQLDLLLAGSRPEDIAAAQARLAQAMDALRELRNGNRPEQIKAARAAALAARASAESVAETVNERVVVAPHDGIVDRIPVADGDLVPAGASVVTLQDPSDIWIRIYVPEDRLAHVSVGDRAVVRVDGISGNVDMVVDSISSQGEFTPVNLQSPDERGKQVFAVRLRPVERVPGLKPGMYATVISLGGVR